ncbi:hypothetical protein [Paracoccus aerius]|uniref:hypothetical protein n=1 Tax=Paracoccus aerius TaxID=1915382 RepID=UPI001F19312E|nr:hypothetical protein [Paracoccus aerius]
MLEYLKEYPDILHRRSVEPDLSTRPSIRRAALTERDGKSDFVCGGASAAGPVTEPMEECTCV